MRVCPRCSIETEELVCPVDGATTFAVQSGQETYPPGEVLAGRYQVDAVLGVGGFGAVYKCTQLAMNQTVAVKVLRNEHLSSVEHVKRFTREAQAVSKLKHPNTIHTFDFGTHTDGALYLAMEFLEGETLADRLDANGVIYWETLVRIATQVCHSLTEAHALGLVHRDLKPENIMLIPVAGDPNFVKVLDFGIAKMQKDPAKPGEASLTEAGMIMGTPTYMSPEQAKGEGIDHRSDIYSLGVMMYEALTGTPPFHDETAMKVLVAHIKDPPKPFVRTGASDEPPFELERVVLACLEKEPDLRPQTTTQLVDRLTTAARRARDSASFAAVVVDRPTTTLPLLQPPVPATLVVPASRLEPGLTPLPTAAMQVPPDRAPAGRVDALPPSRMPLYIAVGAFAAVAVGAVVALVVAGQSPQVEPVPLPTPSSEASPAPQLAPLPPPEVVRVAAPLAAPPSPVVLPPAPAPVPPVPAAVAAAREAAPAPPPAAAAAEPKVAATKSGQGSKTPGAIKSSTAAVVEPKAAGAAAGPSKATTTAAEPAKTGDSKPDDKSGEKPADKPKKGPHHDDFRLDDDKTDK